MCEYISFVATTEGPLQLYAAHLVAAIPHNPWAPLVEIMALGCVPIGVNAEEFIVWRPACK